MKEIDAINSKNCLPVNSAVCFSNLFNAAQALNVLIRVYFFFFCQGDKEPPIPQSHNEPTGVFPDIY